MSVKTKSVAESNSKPLAEALIAEWSQGIRPVFLKINDRHKLEIKDEASFQLLLGLLERLENISAIQKGLDDFDAGRSMSLEAYQQRVRAKHGISD